MIAGRILVFGEIKIYVIHDRSCRLDFLVHQLLRLQHLYFDREYVLSSPSEAK